MTAVTGGARGAAQVFERVSPSLSPRPAPNMPPVRQPNLVRSAQACARLRAAMLGSAGRRALLIACLPALFLTGPLSPGAAQAADVTITTPTTGTAGNSHGFSFGNGGSGGAGGTGLAQTQVGTVTINATVSGGAGGKGGDGGDGNGGSGGAGGTGLAQTQGGTVTINAAVSGGAGGNGGTGGNCFGNGCGVGNGGSGAAGGPGLALTQGGTVTINAAVTGGAGGNGGTGGTGVGGQATGSGGAGDTGGAGLVMTQGGTVMVNAAVTGGAGGTGAGGGSGAGAHGTGGAGLTGSGMTLTLGGQANVTGGLSGGGTRANAITFTGGTNALSIQAGATLTGGISLGTNTTMLEFAQTNDYTLNNVISGSGSVVKTGAGALTLTGVNTYSGATTVSSGRLIVNGSIANSSVAVNTGGTLGGSGTVGTTSINGGTLAPGNSIGTLSVNGNLSFTAASTYAVEVSPAASDRVNVTGTATLGGARVAASFEPGTYVARQYTILNATGGVVGTFGQKVDTNLPSGFKSALSYDTNNAFLDLTLDFTPTPPGPTPPDPTPPVSPIPNRGLNRNQTAVANALTGYFNSNGGIPAVFGSLTPAGLSQAAGEPATGVQQTSTTVMNQFMTSLTAIAPDGRGVPLAPAPTGFASYSSARGQAGDLPTRKGAMAPAIMPDPDLWRWSVWAGGYGAAQFNGAEAGTGAAATTSRIYGAMAGADYRIAADTVAGFALGGGATSFNTFGLGSGTSDLFQAGAFIRQQMGRSHVTASVAYAWQDVTTDRSVAGLDRLQGRFNANSWSGRIEAGHRFGLASVGVTPYAAGQFSTLSLPGYRETALSGPGTFALAYAGQDTSRLRGELGLRADAQLIIAGKPLKLEAGAAWIRNGNTGTRALASFQTLPGASFSVGGTALDRNALRTTASAELRLSPALTLATTLEGEFAQNSRSLGGKAALRYSW